MRSRLLVLATLSVGLVACSALPPPVSPPAILESASPPPVSSSAATGSGTHCPPRQFDTGATLGPEFDQDVFRHDESRAIAADFLAGLATILADPSADVCRYFTEQGWRTSLAFDPRLAAYERGESTVTKELVLRVAYEGVYDLRDRPPVLPLDLVFDIPAGAKTTDVATGETQVSTSLTREGFHADFAFDGHSWRVDRLGPVADVTQTPIAIPSPPPPGRSCADFVRDPSGSPFDEHAGRRWCDRAGRGRVISRDALAMLTRYPCEEGHAAILAIGWPLGSALDPLARWEYVRDPANEFLRKDWVTARYDGSARLPPDAVDSGCTNGNVDLWISSSELDRAVYLVRGTTVERWPRAAEHWGVIDCN